MLLLSRASQIEMVAELVPLDRTQPCPENKLDFKLQKPFTNNHQVTLVFADQKKRIAYFCTQSFHERSTSDIDKFIDHVHFLKVAVDAAGKLNDEQVDLLLPEQQVNAKVVFT